MQIYLEAIKFNHDPTSNTGDAFNIRKNDFEQALFPEWQRGRSFTADDSVAAYAIERTKGQELSIQAKFKSSNPNSTVKIQAVDASSPFLAGNILGTAKETDVTFGANGESGFVPFCLDNVRLEETGVGISKNVWRWQFLAPGEKRWADFAISAHKIYSVVDLPREPWSQTISIDNTQLPWTEVLEVACDWAAGAKNVVQAAELITRNVYGLGLGLVGYQGSPATYAFDNFNCTDFLKLLRGQFGMGKRLNCSDCATIVSTFSNILGCNTSQVRFGGFDTNPIILISHSKPAPRGFFYHEVAWTGDTVAKGAVFDACLQVDGDSKPQEINPFTALLPANLPFELPNQHHYRFRVDLDNRILPKKIPGGHRPIGNHALASFPELDRNSLNLLEQRFHFDKWKDLPASPTSQWTDVLVPQSGSRQQTWAKVNQRCQDFEDGTKLKSRLFRDGNTDFLLREDLFRCHDPQAARAVILRLLGEYMSTEVERLEDPGFADVVFVAADGSSALFAYQESVVLIRSDCGKKITLNETGLQISDLLSGR